MCKFTNRLFVFTLLALLAVPRLALIDAAAATREHRKGAADAKFLDLLSLNDFDNNYDVHYDQRQKGDENLRVRMDGFFIEMPPDDTDVAADDLLNEIRDELLLGLADVQSSKSSTRSPDKSQQDQLGALKVNNLDSDQRSNTQQRDVIEAVSQNEVVEGRNSATYQRSGLVAANREPESKRVGVITKQHFNTLLNLLKRMRRN